MLPYRIFLLTCWQEHESAAGLSAWRFRLEEPRTSEQHGFDGLEVLLTFLETKLADSDEDQRAGE